MLMNIEEFIQGVETHQELNPVVWANTDHIDPQVREALLRTAREFWQFVNVQASIIDIIVTGSQANYLYTSASDLDLHIIVAFKSVECQGPVSELFDAQRKLWKQEHDIRYRGIPVECYVEDSQHPVKGSSYSLLKDRWVRRPEPIKGTLPSGVERVTAAWTRIIAHGIAERNIELLHEIKGMLSQYRKIGLAQEGELSRANIVFKTLRNNGVIAQLMKSLVQLRDQDLTVR